MKRELDRVEEKGCLRTAVYKEVPETDMNAVPVIKKEKIIAILSESDQLNLMATIIEQIGDAIALNTPEFQYGKTEFAKIKAILG